jgi:hypothetical protein
MQFSLRQLLYATAFTGVACAALIYASALWAAAAFSLAIALLLAAIVLAYAAQGRQRAFWIGFAVCGWGYLAMLHSPILTFDDSTHWHGPSEGPPLISSMILDRIYFDVLSLVHSQPQLDPMGMVIPGSSNYPTSDHYYRVGHSLFTLLAALAGGALGSWAFTPYRKTESESAVE